MVNFAGLSKNELIVSLIFFIVFLFSISFVLWRNLGYFLLSASFSLVCSSFSSFSSYKVRLLDWNRSCFLMWRFIAVHFSLSLFSLCPIICYDVFSFLFISMYFEFPLWFPLCFPWLFRTVLFNFHKFVNFPVLLLLLIANFILL